MPRGYSPRAVGALVAVLIAQAALGLLFPHEYRDADWIRAAWFGNDWVTLAVAAPMLAIAHAYARRGSVRGTLTWLGLLAFSAYNSAYYLFGAALNKFFPFYVVGFVLSTTILARSVHGIDPNAVMAAFRTTTPSRMIGGYLAFVGAGLAFVWTALWAGHAFAGQRLPIETEAFKLVAALDLTAVVPILTAGGVLLWRNTPWGYVFSAIGAIQASLYLLVLTVGAAVAVHRGLSDAPGEVPLWGLLGALTAVVTIVLLVHARDWPPLAAQRAVIARSFSRSAG